MPLTEAERLAWASVLEPLLPLLDILQEDAYEQLYHCRDDRQGDRIRGELDAYTRLRQMAGEPKPLEKNEETNGRRRSNGGLRKLPDRRTGV